TEYFLPTDEDREPSFREELLRLAVVGLRAIGWIGLFTPILTLALATMLTPRGWSKLLLGRMLALTVLGATVLLLSFVASLRRFARLLGGLTGIIAATVLVGSSIAISRELPEEAHHLPAYISLVMLICLATLPLRPLQTLVLGLSI